MSGLFNFKASNFADRLSGISRAAIIGSAVSVANEVGIFQVLADAGRPLTSHEVAQAGGLKERFVRELLGSLSTAELVETSEKADGELEYSLEDGAKETLDGQLGRFINFPSLIASNYHRVKECIYKDGPTCVRYTDQLQDFLDGLSLRGAPGIAKLLPELVPDLKTRLEEGIDAIEFGSGRARLSAILAQQFPNSRFVASEVVPSLVQANKERWAHIPNLSFSLDDLCTVPEKPEKQFDWGFCCDVIHDLPYPVEALRGAKRMLREPNGVFSFLDIATSGSPVADRGNSMVSAFYSLGSFFCIPESYQRQDSRALGPCYGRQTAVSLALEAGFQVKDIMIEDFSAVFVCSLPQPT